MSEKSKNDVAAMIAAIREEAVVKAMTAAIANMNMTELKKWFTNRFFNKDVKAEFSNIEFEIQDLQLKLQRKYIDHISKQAALCFTSDEERANFIMMVTPKPKAKRGRKSATKTETETATETEKA